MNTNTKEKLYNVAAFHAERYFDILLGKWMDKKFCGYVVRETTLDKALAYIEKENASGAVNRGWLYYTSEAR